MRLADVRKRVVSKFWAPDLRYRSDYIGADELGPYYMDLSMKEGEPGEREAHGGFTSIYPPTGERYFHPIKNTHYALAAYAKYIDQGDTTARDVFSRVTDGIVANGVLQADGSRVWHYPHSYFPGQLTPWISAMAQGQVVGVLARAAELSGEPRYLEVADEAFRTFLKPIREGGVRSDDASYGVFYEEYAHREVRHQDHTLNGMTSALMCLWDLWKLTGREAVRDVFDEGVATILKNVERFEFSFCSSYDLRHLVRGVPPVFNPHYNAVHVSHFQVLAAMSGEDRFAEVAERWRQTLRRPQSRLLTGATFARTRARRALGLET